MPRRAVSGDTTRQKIGKDERNARIAAEEEWRHGKLTDFEPTMLNDDGRIAFNVIASAIPAEKIAAVDGYTIETAANAIARMAQANAAIEREGLTVERLTKTGMSVAANPNISIYKSYSEIARHYLVELGCTPSARAKIASDAAKQLARPQGVRAKLNA